MVNHYSRHKKGNSSFIDSYIQYVPIAGAKADTDPVVASAIAAKILIMDEKRNMLTFFILYSVID